MSRAVDFLTQLMSARRHSPARRIALTALLALLLSVGMVTFAPPAFAAGNEDWPTFLHDAQRTAASGETILSTANAATLKLRWTYLTGGPIAASPTLVGGVVYVGSWDGYEYAIDAKAGTIKWKTFLGQTTTPNCNPTLIGITSAATVLNNVVYVGGGDSNWYALDAGTGTVLWSVPTGDNSITGGHYNWSSPLIANGSAYIGIASNCDNPLVQGELLRVDLTSHTVAATAKFVPDGQVGGGVWTSPALDTATNTVYVTTGTQNLPSQTMPQGLVSLNAATLAINGSWQIPPADALNDADFGNSPILFTTAAGRALVAATNKNGYVYAFDRANVSAGPIWRTRIAIGGECPTCGDGSVSSMAFAKGVLYAAGGNTIIGGVGYQGSVRALDPATGNIIWEHGTAQPVVPALAYDNGLVIDGAGNILEVLDASTGKRLYTYQAGGGIYSAPSVWNGKIYFGALDSKVYSLTLPGTITLPPPDPQCPASWTCEDIGNPAAGTESYAGGTWTVTAAGTQGLHGTSDQFRLISQPASGDMQVSAQIVSQQSDGAPPLGPNAAIIVRQSDASNAPFYAVVEYPTNIQENQPQPVLRIWYRNAFGGQAIQANKIYPNLLPSYVMIQRVGDIFTAAVSTDGVNYQLLPGSRTQVVMPNTVLTGLATSSGFGTTTSQATYANVTIGQPTTSLAQPPTAHPCPAPWSCQDVGNPAPVGDQTYASPTYTLQGIGSDIAFYQDQFHFVYQNLPGDGSLSARITSQVNTSAVAKSGIMIRQSTDAGSPYYGLLVTPGGSVIVQYRAIQNLRTFQVSTTTGTLPLYARVARWTDTTTSPPTPYFTAYTSTDGVTWSAIPWSTVSINMSGTLLAGMAASSHAVGKYSAVTYDSVSLATGSPPPPTLCPTSWSCADVGFATPAGSQMVTNGSWTVRAGGNDIWDIFDQFRYSWQSLASDGTISAHITQQSNTDPWAKVGVMLRATTDPGSPYYALFATPGNGLALQYRPTQGATTNQVLFTGTVPTYLQVAKWTDTRGLQPIYYFSAYTSTDGVTWTLLTGSTVTIGMPGALLAGVAATSHNSGLLAVDMFDTVVVGTTSTMPPTVCPNAWACADIGNATPPGSQTLAGGVWTINGGGGDIWGTADAFRLISQTLAADGSASAHVTAQGATDPWAKAGVMLRATTDPGSPYYALFVTPGNGLTVQYRSTQGGSSAQAAALAGTVPAYLLVSRAGTTFAAYTSTDGVTWTLVPGSTVTIASLTGSIQAGLAVTSHNSAALSTVTMDTVTVSTFVPFACPAGWTCGDLGGATPVGNQAVSNGVWTINGGGGDIWGTADAFRFMAQTLPGDGSASAHVTAQGATDPWAKAGVMLRATTDPGSPYYALFVTPANGLTVQYRATQGVTSVQTASLAGTVPAYLLVSRVGTSFSAYTSTDGITWTLVPGSTVTLGNLAGGIQAGLAVTSHNSAALSTVVMDTVSVSTSHP